MHSIRSPPSLRGRPHRSDAADAPHPRAPVPQPFLVAKGAATLDLLSAIVRALGGRRLPAGRVHRARRGLRAAQRAVRRGGRGDAGRVEHRRVRLTFKRAQTANPKPKNVPIWIGEQPGRPGASGPLRRRLVPFPPAALSRTTKTPGLETPADLAAMIEDLRRMLDENGRDPSSIDIALSVRGRRGQRAGRLRRRRTSRSSRSWPPPA